MFGVSLYDLGRLLLEAAGVKEEKVLANWAPVFGIFILLFFLLLVTLLINLTYE